MFIAFYSRNVYRKSGGNEKKEVRLKPSRDEKSVPAARAPTKKHQSP